MSQPRPCGNAVEYSLCYHPYVSGGRVTPSSEYLMRSHYCVFAMQDAGYLTGTWHPSCGAAALRAELMTGFAHTGWLGLTVFGHCWQDADNIGSVSFIARFIEGGKTGAIIERSRFLEENGQWYYIDSTRPQFGRNDPCPCGSGKKLEKCYGQ